MQTGKPAFGQRMHCAGIVLKGTLTDAVRWIELLEAIAEAIGMSAVEEPKVWSYPTANGSGGVGMTIVLPITESFLALDTWSDHDAAYLFVCSCRLFHTADIDKVAQTFSLKVTTDSRRRFYNELDLT